MAGRLAAVVPTSRSRSPQAVARADPGDMIGQVRGVSGTTVASIEMHTHDQCRVLKRRISPIPQRTCVQEGTTMRVMASFAPCGIMLDVVVIHASSIKVLACVNMAWLHSVRTVIRELRRGFLNGDFNVGCLAPEVLHDGQAKMRLQRILCLRYGNRVLDEDVVWWFRTQLYLQYAVGKSKMSFQDLLHRCYLFSSYRGYDFDIFEGVYRHCGMSQETLGRSLASQLFHDARFVYARDLGCQHLGRSIREVLQTLICASDDATFCPYVCGCADKVVYASRRQPWIPLSISRMLASTIHVPLATRQFPH